MRRSHFVGVVTIFDLARCVQRDGESPREYLARWIRVRETLEGDHADELVYHFVEGLMPGTPLRHTLRRRQAAGPLTLGEMVAIVNEYTDTNEEAKAAITIEVVGGNNNNNSSPPSPSTSAIANTEPNSDSVLDALYANINMDAGGSDINSEEYDAVMREIEKEECAEKTNTSHQVLVAIGSMVEEDGHERERKRAPPTPAITRVAASKKVVEPLAPAKAMPPPVICPLPA